MSPWDKSSPLSFSQRDLEVQWKCKIIEHIVSKEAYSKDRKQRVQKDKKAKGAVQKGLESCQGKC